MGRQPRDPEEIASLRRSISAAIRPAREARGLTQQQVAEFIDVSVEFYGRLERGKALPRLETLITIADVLQLSVDTMLAQWRARTTTPEPNPDIDHIVERCRNDDEILRVVTCVLAAFEEAENRRG